jgi:hypothetical protein
LILQGRYTAGFRTWQRNRPSPDFGILSNSFAGWPITAAFFFVTLRLVVSNRREGADSMKALKIMASLALAAAAFSQMQDNQTKQMTCEKGGHGDRARYCEIREQPVAPMGLLNVDAGQNGGATIKARSRNEVLVRARVESWGISDSDARGIASQVYIDTSGGHVQARGPESANNAGWSASFEILVPQATNLTVKTVNRGITISDIRGELQFEATNVGIHLARVAGFSRAWPVR